MDLAKTSLDLAACLLDLATCLLDLPKYDLNFKTYTELGQYDGHLGDTRDTVTGTSGTRPYLGPVYTKVPGIPRYIRARTGIAA